MTDYPADYGCSAAGGASEAFCTVDPDFSGVIASPTTTGTLAGKSDNYDVSCAFLNDATNDTVYALQLPVPVIALRLDTKNVPAGNYSVQVDSWGGGNNNGPFVLNTHGVVATGTACTSPLFASGVLVCPPGSSCTGGTCQ